MAKEIIEGKLMQSIKGTFNQEIKMFFLEKENKYFILLDCVTRRVLLLTDDLLIISVGSNLEETLESIKVSDGCELTSQFQLFGKNVYNTPEMEGYFYIFEDLWNAKILKVSIDEVIKDIKHIAHMYI